MGANQSYFSYVWDSWVHPEFNPPVDQKSKFDPTFGFKDERQLRHSLVSEEDMYWAHIKPSQRDYCAHHLIDLNRCKRANFPLVGECNHYKHEWDRCQYQDQINRMKDYERERRLLRREHRIKEKEAKEQLVDHA